MTSTIYKFVCMCMITLGLGGIRSDMGNRYDICLWKHVFRAIFPKLFLWFETSNLYLFIFFIILCLNNLNFCKLKAFKQNHEKKRYNNFLGVYNDKQLNSE